MDVLSADWERLKIFRAVAETGSLAAAAEALRVSPAKVSRDIEALEYELGQELFVRSTRGMSLTAVGNVVLESVRNMADSARALSTNVLALTQGSPARTVVATHDALATYWLAPQLSAFHSENPGVELALKVGFETPRVGEDGIDIAIQYEEPRGPNLISRPLGWIHYVFQAADGYLSVHGVPEDRFALGRHRLLHHEGYNKQPEQWEAKLPAWQQIMPWLVTTNSSTVLIEACARGAGIASLPSYLPSVEPRLRPLLHLKHVAKIRFWLVYTQRVRDTPACRPLLDWLKAAFDPNTHPWFRETFEEPI